VVGLMVQKNTRGVDKGTGTNLKGGASNLDALGTSNDNHLGGETLRDNNTPGKRGAEKKRNSRNLIIGFKI